jgi:hypothetical protein
MKRLAGQSRRHCGPRPCPAEPLAEAGDATSACCAVADVVTEGGTGFRRWSAAAVDGCHRGADERARRSPEHSEGKNAGPPAQRTTPERSSRRHRSPPSRLGGNARAANTGPEGARWPVGQPAGSRGSRPTGAKDRMCDDAFRPSRCPGTATALPARPPLLLLRPDGRAHSMPVRADNYGQQRCFSAPQRCTPGFKPTGQTPYGHPSAVASQAESASSILVTRSS